MRTVITSTVILVGIHAVGLSAALAQDGGSLTIDIGQCVTLESEGERLACYERLANAAIASEASASAVSDSAASTSPATSSPVPAVSAAAAAGAERATLPADPVAPARPGPGAETRAPSVDREETLSTITAVEEIVPNRYRISLENGQVWRQTQAKRFLLRPGYHVRIYPSRWGESYRLTAEESNGFIQVERVH